MKSTAIFLTLLSLVCTKVTAGEPHVREWLLAACSNATDVVIGTVQSAQPIMEYTDNAHRERTLFGVVLGVETNLFGDASDRILVLLNMRRHSDEWGPRFQMPLKSQRYLSFVTRLNTETSKGPIQLPCFLPAYGLLVTTLIRERSAEDSNGYGFIRDEMLFDETHTDPAVAVASAGSVEESESKLAHAVQAFIVTGLNPRTLNDLAETVRRLKPQRAKTSDGSAALSRGATNAVSRR